MPEPITMAEIKKAATAFGEAYHSFAAAKRAHRLTTQEDHYIVDAQNTFSKAEDTFLDLIAPVIADRDRLAAALARQTMEPDNTPNPSSVEVECDRLKAENERMQEALAKIRDETEGVYPLKSINKIALSALPPPAPGREEK